jgi:hypothetical protein
VPRYCRSLLYLEITIKNKELTGKTPLFFPAIASLTPHINAIELSKWQVFSRTCGQYPG